MPRAEGEGAAPPTPTEGTLASSSLPQLTVLLFSVCPHPSQRRGLRRAGATSPASCWGRSGAEAGAPTRPLGQWMDLMDRWRDRQMKTDGWRKRDR